MPKQEQPFEASLQDLIYSVDSSTGTRFLRATVFCMLLLLLTILFTAREFRGLQSEAAMDSAQLGRNLARTGSYVTQCVRPVSMAQVSTRNRRSDPMIDQHPELFRAPLYPALLAGAFRFYELIGVDLFPSARVFEGSRVYPAEQWVVIPINHLFTSLSGLFIYLLGARLFSRKTGFLGVLVYFLMESVWRDSVHGDGMPVLVFFTLGAVFFSLKAVMNRREGRPVWNWVSFYLLSVLCATAAFYTHYAALAMIPGIALFILLSGTRTHRSLVVAVLYPLLILMLVSPWLARNVKVSGSPFGLAPHTALVGSSRFPGDAMMRTLNPRFRTLSDFKVARAKWVEHMTEHYNRHLMALGGGLLAGFFLVTFFYRFVRDPVHYLRFGIGLSLGLFFIGAGFFGEASLRYYHLFRPYMILYGLAFFLILLDRLDFSISLYKSIATGVVVGLSSLPLVVTLFFAPAPGMPYPPYHVPFILRVSELLRPSEVLCTDIPWATAWYGNRTSILLPQSVNDFFEINDYHKYISGLYFTTETKDRPFVSHLLDGPDRSWLPLAMGRAQGFPLSHGFALYRQDQIFLTDSARWAVTAPQAPAPRDASREPGQ